MPSRCSALIRSNSSWPRPRRQAGGGLVEQHQPRRRHQRHRDREHLALPAGERARLLRAPLGEHREARKALLIRSFDGAAVDIAAHFEVRLDAERGKHVRLLRHERDALPGDLAGAQTADRLALEGDRALARRQEPRDRFQQCRFAGAVRARSARPARARATVRSTPLSTSSCAPYPATTLVSESIIFSFPPPLAGEGRVGANPARVRFTPDAPYRLPARADRRADR